ncbi:MAG TPA: choice-of-anchor L domain-containing protein [Coriobacteriia bacterium]|nr:choice-of-anchor L domain-containing protein [Coriobacteriia bacterium]
MLLSTGRAADAIGPNVSDDWSTDNGTAGDDALGGLVGYPTYDAALLSFDFVPNGDRVYFEYVFSSEEYNEFVNREFDDVFAFYINGMNCATVGSPAVPVSVNTINNGSPYGTDPRSHPELYTSNSMSDGVAYVDTEMDGLTAVLVCEAPVVKGASNHITLAVADVSDARYDSDVFIRADSFSTKPPARFAPKPDGWQVQNGSDTDQSGDWLVWSHMFGDSEKSSSRYEAEKTSATQDGHAGIFDGGNCYGFAASAAAYFTGNRSFGSHVLGLTRPWEFAPGTGGYPAGGIMTGSMQPGALQEIEEFQLAQFEHLATKAELANNISRHDHWGWWGGGEYKEALKGWLTRLDAALQLEPQIITMRSAKPKVKGTGGGHGVVAYRMDTEQGGDLVKLYIYDDNWPGDSTRFIAFWPNVPKWQYQLFDGETWGSADEGDRISFFRAFWPAWAVNSSSPVQYMDTKWSVSHAAQVVFEDAAGNTSGFSAAGDSWQIPDLIPWTRMGAVRGSHHPPVIDYIVPDADAVTMSLRPDGSGAYLAVMPGTDADSYVSAAWPAGTLSAGAADALQVSGDGTTVRLVPGTAAAARIVLATDWGAPSTAIDLAFAPAQTQAGDGSADDVSLAISPIDSGLAVDVTDHRGLVRPVGLSWLGGKTVPVTVPADAFVRIELTGGAAMDQPDQPSTLTVRTDVNLDGEWDTVSTGTVAPPPAEPSGNFRVRGPRTYAAPANGIHRRSVVLKYRGTTAYDDKLKGVRIVVKNARGRVVRSIALGARISGRWYTTRWTPTAKGRYKYFVYAKDSLGIAQSTVGRARIVVR